jgi:hypothetical protein
MRREVTVTDNPEVASDGGFLTCLGSEVSSTLLDTEHGGEGHGQRGRECDEIFHGDSERSVMNRRTPERYGVDAWQHATRQTSDGEA